MKRYIIYLQTFTNWLDRKKFTNFVLESYDFLKPTIVALQEVSKDKDEISDLFDKICSSTLAREQFFFGIYVKQGIFRRSELVGMITVSNYNQDTNEVELGCLLGEQFVGNGYAQQAVALAEKWLRKQRISTVRLEIDPTNFSSTRLAQRCDYTRLYSLDGNDIYKKTL